MLRNIVRISAGILLAAIGGAAVSLEQFQPQPLIAPSPVQVIRPEVEVLDRPVILEVQVEPGLGVDTSMKILCATNTYRGEVHVERQDTRVRLTISGEIKELGTAKIFISFDVEAQSEDVSGGGGFAAAGGAILVPAKPSPVLTIGGKSVILTVTFPPEETKPEPAGSS